MITSTFKIFSINTLLLCGLIIPVLSSCEKAADPTVIKVSSTTLPGGGTTGGGTTGGGTTGGGTTGGGTTGGGTTGGGTGSGTVASTISANGDGGVPIGATNSIVFTLKGKTYTLSTGNDFFVGCTHIAKGTKVGDITAPENLTTISGVTLRSDMNFILGVNSAGTGIFNVSGISITLADGTEYGNNFPAKVNFKTFTVKGNTATTQGTFDAVMYNTKTIQIRSG